MDQDQEILELNKEKWILGSQIGGGGFSKVYDVESMKNDKSAVVKIVPKKPGAQRELLFENLDNIRNVIPIIDRGEFKDNWVLVMPKAKKSLRQHLNNLDSLPNIAEIISILSDITIALLDIEKKVVHRDLKPENILYYNGKWCLADFGISRYAEAATASDTRKCAFTPPYTAPERWNYERATISTDVYSLGIIAYELFAGSLPFEGPNFEGFRSQHLKENPKPLDSGQIPSWLNTLIIQCLNKPPESRPSPKDILDRFQKNQNSESSEASKALQDANLNEVKKKFERECQISERKAIEERQKALVDCAFKDFKIISDELKEQIMKDATDAELKESERSSWSIHLGRAKLELGRPQKFLDSSRNKISAFNVLAYATLKVEMETNNKFEMKNRQYRIIDVNPSLWDDDFEEQNLHHNRYKGRVHSIWYGDIQEQGHYKWFETAFSFNAFFAKQSSSLEPFSLDPSHNHSDVSFIFSNTISKFELARKFIPLNIGNLNEFIDRWKDWLAKASQGNLESPRRMPEEDYTNGSYRST